MFFVRRAIELDQFVVDLSLVACIPAFECRRDLLVHIGDCFLHTFAAEPAFVAVAQFPCFMLTGARPAWNRRPPQRAAFHAHIHLDRRIAA